jgi:hypothetical protein
MDEPMYTDEVMSMIASVTQHFLRRDLHRISIQYADTRTARG